MRKAISLLGIFFMIMVGVGTGVSMHMLRICPVTISKC